MPKPRTTHTNMLNRPDFIVAGEANTPDPRWCAVCRCWDTGLIETEDGSAYTHPDHEDECVNGSPTCTPDDPCVVCYDQAETTVDNPVTTFVSSTDGTTYLRTQYGNSAAEIAEALRPYVGRTMTMDLPNTYGHFHRYSGELRSVDGDMITVYVPRLDHTATVNAFDAFGTHCTMIDKEI